MCEERSVEETAWLQVIDFLQTKFGSDTAPSIRVLKQEARRRFQKLRRIVVDGMDFRWNPATQMYEIQTPPLSNNWLVVTDLRLLSSWKPSDIRALANLKDSPYTP